MTRWNKRRDAPGPPRGTEAKVDRPCGFIESDCASPEGEHSPRAQRREGAQTRDLRRDRPTSSPAFSKPLPTSALPSHGKKQVEVGSVDADLDETYFAGVSVYDGTRRLGDVRDRGRQAEAVLVDGTVLGRFANRRLATDAILAATRELVR